MRTIRDLTGERFGSLIAIKQYKTAKYIMYICKCDCGKQITTYSYNLNSGKAQSCGCQKGQFISEKNIVHGGARRGLVRSAIYDVWMNMKQRCLNKNHPGYDRYGGRGITICERWMTFENFRDDMGDPPNDMSIDRKNNDGNYEPENCKWSTQEEQCNNKTQNNQYTV